MRVQWTTITAALLFVNMSWAIGKAPLLTGLRCTIGVLDSNLHDQQAVIDLNAVNPGRQVTDLVVKHGDVTFTLVGPTPSFPAYTLANQINNIHQTKILVVDPTMPDAGGKKSENINIKFKLKVAYKEDKTGKSLYSGSILYSFPYGAGTLDASGPTDCLCTDSSKQVTDCAKASNKDQPDHQENP